MGAVGPGLAGSTCRTCRRRSRLRSGLKPDDASAPSAEASIGREVPLSTLDSAALPQLIGPADHARVGHLALRIHRALDHHGSAGVTPDG